MRIRLCMSLVALALSACGRVCPEVTDLLDSDGGVQRCVSATDCLHPSGVLICSSTDDQQRDCVGCDNTVCKRYVPRACP